MGPSSQCCLPCQECQDPSDLSDIDNIDEAIDNELLSLSNPQSREGNGNRGSGGFWSLQHLLWSWPLGGQCGNGLWLELTSLGVFLGGTSDVVKSIGLLGQQIYT